MFTEDNIPPRVNKSRKNTSGRATEPPPAPLAGLTLGKHLLDFAEDDVAGMLKEVYEKKSAQLGGI